MPKQGEIEYLAQLGAVGVEHARGKPYTNSDCGTTLVAMGTIMALLPPPPGRLLDLGCGSGGPASCLRSAAISSSGRTWHPR